MAREMVLEEVQTGGVTEVGRLNADTIPVGREPGGQGIAVNNAAISRTHGMFLRVRNHWFYRDLGSTNGSWVNGDQVPGNGLALLRSGDVLQLADTALRVVDVGDDGAGSLGANRGMRSLIVFAEGEFVEEFPVPEYGRALTIGGTAADLLLDGNLDENPTAVFERRGDDVFIVRGSRDVVVSYRGSEVTSDLRIADRGIVGVGKYSVLFSDPNAPARATPLAANPQSAPAGAAPTPGSRILDWGREESDRGTKRPDAQRPSGRSVFGQRNSPSQDELQPDETIAIDPRDVQAKISAYDVHPSMRYTMRGQEGSNTSLEDKLIVLVGSLLLLAVIGVMIWWAFM